MAEHSKRAVKKDDHGHLLVCLFHSGKDMKDGSRMLVNTRTKVAYFMGKRTDDFVIDNKVTVARRPGVSYEQWAASEGYALERREPEDKELS